MLRDQQDVILGVLIDIVVHFAAEPDETFGTCQRPMYALRSSPVRRGTARESKALVAQPLHHITVQPRLPVQSAGKET